MKILGLTVGMILLLGLATPAASAANISLAEFAFNVDGTMNDFLPPSSFTSLSGFDLSGFDLTTGLGTIQASISGAGAHSLFSFFDPDIDVALNSFFNELGSATGILAGGQSWEIGDPWGSTIYTDVSGGLLTNSNLNGATPNDVAMAIGWNFTLTGSDVAKITFKLSQTQPSSGFYLTQWDPDSIAAGDTSANIYFSSALNIGTPGPGPLSRSRAQ